MCFSFFICNIGRDCIERIINLKNFVISVDSSANFTKSEIEKYELLVAHLSYTLDGKVYKDVFENDAHKQVLYDQLAAGHLAQSSKVNPESYISIWHDALEKGRDILHFSLSGSVSGSYDSACFAAKELSKHYNSRIEVIDTKTGTFAITALVYDLIGKHPDATIDEAKDFALSVLNEYNLLFTVGDIKYLRRGGRISHIKALVGGLLNLKPILFVNEEGKLTFLSNVRGMKKAVQLMISKMEKNVTHHTNYAYISHGGDERMAKTLKKKIIEAFPNLQNVYIDYLTPVLGLHAGPGSLVLSFRGAPRDNVLQENPIQDMLDKIHLAKLKKKTIRELH